jgi:hypothetical protein
MSGTQPQETVPEPESGPQDGDPPTPFERRYRVPPGGRVVTPQPGEVVVVVGAVGMKPPSAPSNSRR